MGVAGPHDRYRASVGGRAKGQVAPELVTLSRDLLSRLVVWHRLPQSRCELRMACVLRVATLS